MNKITVSNDTIKERYSMKLGRRLEIGALSKATVCNPSRKIEYMTETISVIIGIGDDNYAELIMSKETWEAFIQGEKIFIRTHTITKNKTKNNYETRH